MTNLLVFFVRLLGDELGLGELGLEDGDPVVLHVGLVLKRLADPAPKQTLKISSTN